MYGRGQQLLRRFDVLRFAPLSSLPRNKNEEISKDLNNIINCATERLIEKEKIIVT